MDNPLDAVSDSSDDRWFKTALALLRDLPNPVAVLDPQTLQILDANQSALATFGYTREEALAMTLYDITPVSEHAEMRRRAASFGRETSQFFGPMRHVTKNGRIVILENVAIPAIHRGKLVGINILSDVTDKIYAQERDRSIFENFPLPMWVYDPVSLRFLDVNKTALASYGYGREEFLNMPITQLATPGAVARFRELTPSTAGHLCDIYEHVRKDGSLLTVEIESDIIPFGGTEKARLVVAKDVTEKLGLEAAADAARRRLEEAQEIAHLGSFEYDFSTHRMYVSTEAMRIMGLTPQTVPAYEEDLLRWFHPDDHDTINEAIRAAWPNGAYMVEVRLARADGSIRWVSVRAKGTYVGDTRRPLTVTGTMLDITDRKSAERDLRFLAFHDPLTQLPNRSSLPAILEQALEQGPFAVFYIDFDGFSEVNDSFGHGFGDAVLRVIAERLTNAIGGEGQVCRWGGDEFVVIVPVPDDSSDAYVPILRTFQESLQPVYEFDDRELFITASIGVALYPRHGRTVEDLIRNADMAMYEAKNKRNASAVFNPRMFDAAKRRLELQNGLHQALRLKQFVLHFQPVVSAKGGKVLSAEALIRWNDPGWGLRFPGEFIETAEQSGLIVEIGEWVIGEACRCTREFHDQGVDIPIAVNVSSKEFEHGRVVEHIDVSLAAAGVKPQSLIVEITETGIMLDVQRSGRIMSALRSRGIGIALDDFGTGYSSLGHLKSFPIDVLKIDRKLLADVVTVEQDREIVTAVVQLGKATNLEVVAEGVESAEQHEMLAQLGCDAFQGYYYCRPVPADKLLEFVGSNGAANSR